MKQKKCSAIEPGALAEHESITSHSYLRGKPGCKELFGCHEAVGLLKNKAKPIQTGFATGSPGAPHSVCASDHIRASWVKADITIIEIGTTKSSV